VPIGKERRGEEEERQEGVLRAGNEGGRERESEREYNTCTERARVLHFGLMYGVALRDGAHWLRANLADEVHRNG
jgi:hypothetical protein